MARGTKCIAELGLCVATLDESRVLVSFNTGREKIATWSLTGLLLNFLWNISRVRRNGDCRGYRVQPHCQWCHQQSSEAQVFFDDSFPHPVTKNQRSLVTVEVVLIILPRTPLPPPASRCKTMHCRKKLSCVSVWSTSPKTHAPFWNNVPFSCSLISSALGNNTSPQGSPFRTLSATLTNGDYSNSPTHSRTTTPSPSPSPKMSKKVDPPAAQKPGAIDNTGLIYPNTSKVNNLFVILRNAAGVVATTAAKRHRRTWVILYSHLVTYGVFNSGDNVD